MKLLDLFSGIGGFHLGLEQAGFQFDWVGFSEIDKYAKQTYKKNFPDAVDLGDVRTIQHKDLPKINIITFGSPCQDFSIAGKRAGLDGNRSSLIGEAIRLIAHCKPRFFIWENVKGTFSSNDGRDFWAIIKAFADIGGYRLEWQLLNTRWFLPQNRERIYLVGHLGGASGGQIFPIGETGGKTNKSIEKSRTRIIDTNYMERDFRTYEVVSPTINARDYKDPKLVQIGTIGKDSEATRVYDTTCDKNLKDGGGMGTKTGLYQVDKLERKQDSYDFNSRVYSSDGIAKTLAGDGGNNDNKTGLYEVKRHPLRFLERNQKNIDGDYAFTIDGANTGGVNINSNIRRLTPTECERLQGFPDCWTEGQSDTQRYKQLGNAVSVPVVKAVGERLI